MRRNAVRISTAVVAAALVGASLSACSSSGSTASAGGSADTSFTYWSMWTQNEPQAKVIQAAADGFTKQTGIKVNIQWQGRQVLTKLTPTLRTGSPADLVDESVNALGELVSLGQDTDLTPLYNTKVTGEDQTIGQVIPTKYQQYLQDKNGKPFMVPYEVATEALWFNAAKFPTLSANPPTTFDGLLTLLAQVKASGTAPIALPANDAYWTDLIFQRTLGTDGWRKLATDRSGAAWNDPKVLAAAQQVASLRSDGDFIKGYESSQGTEEETDWAQGKAAFYLSGTWVPSEAAPNVTPGFKFDSIQLPPIDGGNSDAGINFFGFAVPKTAKHADAAEKFIAYFMQKGVLSGISTEALNLTPRADIAPPSQLASVSKALATDTVYADGAHLSVDYPDWMNKVWTPNVTALETGQLSAAAFVKTVKQATVDYWQSQP